MPSTSINKTAKIIAQAIGRRKSAVASVYLYSGNGKIVVNAKPATVYFPGELASMRMQQPFLAAEISKYDVSAKVHGGGPNGQLDALVLGISRALVKVQASSKPKLKSANLLTRDPRERQRRNVGMGGKSRRKKQSPKR
jgi:small subunit ribosomal protein S9